MAKPKTLIAPQVLSDARHRRHNHEGWESIARLHGLSAEVLRCRLDEEYRIRRNTRIKNARHALLRDSERATGTRGIVSNTPPPAYAVEEYLRASSVPRSITATQMGDPLPGRSALDRLSSQHAGGR